MGRSFTLKKLLWIDAIAALSSGIIVSILKTWISEITSLPEKLLTTLAIVSLAYSSFSFYLALRRSTSKGLLKVLVIGNLMYAFFCVVLIIFLYKSINVFGVGYLTLESLFVAALAVFEARQIVRPIS